MSELCDEASLYDLLKTTLPPDGKAVRQIEAQDFRSQGARRAALEREAVEQSQSQVRGVDQELHDRLLGVGDREARPYPLAKDPLVVGALERLRMSLRTPVMDTPLFLPQYHKEDRPQYHKEDRLIRIQPDPTGVFCEVLKGSHELLYRSSRRFGTNT